MKLIHTADLHLDSKLNRHLDDKRARERRNELLLTFQRLVEYAAERDTEAILIAGDLFDVARVSATARNAVLAAIKEHPGIAFYYLRGNHDADAFLQDILKKEGRYPENLKLFTTQWTSYEQTGADGSTVVITGAEANAENNGTLARSLLLDQSRVNIVMLHGQETETAGKKDAEVIPLREYRNLGIDYLALGHIHAPKQERLDARGVYGYAGCLEGRGFDECGPRGFYELTVSDGKLSSEFIPFAQRVMWERRVDVSSAMNSNEAIALIRQDAAQAGISRKDMLKVILSGEVSMEAEFDESYIAQSFEEDFYFVKVVNATVPKVNYEEYAKDASLKGEYIRLIREEVQKEALSEKEAAEIIKLGIDLLSNVRDNKLQQI